MSAQLLPRESVIVDPRKIEQNENYVRTRSEGELVCIVTSYRMEGHQHYYAHHTSGKKYTWYFMFHV